MSLVIGYKTSKLPIMKSLLSFLLLLVSSATLAESGAYAIEVIIFRHLIPETTTTGAQKLRSFSQFPSLEESRPPESLPDDPVGVLPAELPDNLPGVARNDLPDDLRIISQRSTRMDSIWRRLRSSDNYQPLLYAAWQQNRTDYYPPMRIHDQKIIATQLRPPTHIMVADLAALDPLAAYLSTFYQLDGSVQLRRSRFLHLFLDLEYRQEIVRIDSVIEPGFFNENGMQTRPETGTDGMTNYEVFTLKQNRQIRTHEMQYFDTPNLGVLVFVSAIPVN